MHAEFHSVKIYRFGLIFSDHIKQVTLRISKKNFLSDTQCEQDFLEVRFAQLGEGVVSPMARNEQTPEKIACCFNIVTNIHSIIVNCQEFLAVNVLHISFLAKSES